MVLNISIFRLNKIFYSTKADKIILPGLTGKFSVLKNHIPLITLLDIGVLKIFFKKKWTFFTITEGIAQINRNKVSIFIEDFEELNLKKKKM